MDEGKLPPPPAEIDLAIAEDDTGDEVTVDEGEALLRLVLEAHEARIAESRPPRADGVVVGTLAAIDPSGTVRVKFPGGPKDGAPAKVMTTLGPDDVGRELALLFESGDWAHPVVMGKMQVSEGPRASVQVDGGRLEFRADKEIVLSCGDASITLTRAGKILIRGAYVLSRSSGVHRIQGGSVQIN